MNDLSYPRVETCSLCGKDFWSGPHDNGICVSCSWKIERENEKVKAKQKPVPVDVQPRRAEQPKPDQEGYVYVMKSGSRYKIGMTSRKSGRLDEIKGLFPILKLVIQIACKDAGKVETYLHKKFKKQRIVREWYKLTKEDLAWLKFLKDHDLDGFV